MVLIAELNTAIANAELNGVHITENEKFVLTERLVNGKTLEEIGKALNVTRERVRQYESKATKKLYETW